MGNDLHHPLIRAALIVGSCAALAAAAAAVLHASPAPIGWLVALGAFALAVAAGTSAVALGAPADIREPREPHGPSKPVPLPSDVTTRRGAFGRLWGAAAGAFAILAVVPFVALGRKRAPVGTAWRAGMRLVTSDGRALRPDDLVVGAVETVFPQGNIGAPQSSTLLLRLPNDTPDLDPARSDWIAQGNIAYSKVCTHAGCPVAIYRQESLELYCPCHQSIFDVVRGGRPVAGPATRALPQLALDIDAAGYLVARGDYVDPVGPDSWDRTS